MIAMKKLLTIELLLCSLGASALSVNIQVTDQFCVYSGCATASVSGGVPPYTFLWGGGETTQSIYNLAPGPISVTVTDFVGTQATANATIGITAIMDGGWYNTGAYCTNPIWTYTASGFYGEIFFCGTYEDIVAPLLINGMDNGSMSVGPLGEVLAVQPFLGAQPGGYQEAVITDQNGCQFLNHYTFGWPVDFPAITILDVSGACSGQANGSILFSHTAEGHGQQTSIYLRNGNGQIVQPTFLAGTAGTKTLTGLLPGDYWLRQYVFPIVAGSPEFANTCGDSILVSVPDLGASCGNVNGTVYMDYNEDCVMGSAGVETRVPGALLEFQPGPVYATANTSGQYSVNLPSGPHTVQQIATGIAQSCPPPSAPVNVSGVQTLNIGDTALVPVDAQVMLSNGPARPGFDLYYAIAEQNLTPATTGGITIVFTFDPTVTYISASPAPNSVVGNVLTWNEAALGAFGQRSIQVRLQVPPDVGLIGTALNASVALSTANTDADLQNNTAGTTAVITGSYDPNDKLASTSLGSNATWLINEDEWIDYTVRFQNTGTDTAFNVVITDTLPATLDPASIVWGAASHGHTRSLFGQGVLKFFFANILLPDSNVNEPLSHGFVSFRIRPHQPVVPGSLIENTANIYFDFNDPVITEPSVLTAEFSTGVGEVRSEQLHVFPIPARAELNVQSTTLLMRLCILTMDGRMLREEPIQSRSATVDLQGLPAGAYLIRAEDAAGSQSHHPFLIEKN